MRLLSCIGQMKCDGVRVLKSVVARNARHDLCAKREAQSAEKESKWGTVEGVWCTISSAYLYSFTTRPYALRLTSTIA